MNCFDYAWQIQATIGKRKAARLSGFNSYKDNPNEQIQEWDKNEQCDEQQDQKYYRSSNLQKNITDSGLCMNWFIFKWHITPPIH